MLAGKRVRVGLSQLATVKHAVSSVKAANLRKVQTVPTLNALEQKTSGRSMLQARG